MFVFVIAKGTNKIEKINWKKGVEKTMDYICIK